MGQAKDENKILVSDEDIRKVEKERQVFTTFEHPLRNKKELNDSRNGQQSTLTK